MAAVNQILTGLSGSTVILMRERNLLAESGIFICGTNWVLFCVILDRDFCALLFQIVFPFFRGDNCEFRGLTAHNLIPWLRYTSTQWLGSNYSASHQTDSLRQYIFISIINKHMLIHTFFLLTSLMKRGVDWMTNGLTWLICVQPHFLLMWVSRAGSWLTFVVLFCWCLHN